MTDWNSAAFKKLRRKYYDRLKKRGFRDIENDRGDLVDHGSVQDLYQRIGFRSGIMEDIRDYYDWAQEMVLFGLFISAADKKIWGLHARALCSYEIAESVPFTRRWISYKIKTIRTYLRLQRVTDEMRDALIAWDEEHPRKFPKSKR